MGIDLLAFTGHKRLLGPTGTGGLLLADTILPDWIEPPA
jgi:selenocysteine lyase/cysteine desulfurase